MNKQTMSKNVITHCGIIGNVILLQLWWEYERKKQALREKELYLG